MTTIRDISAADFVGSMTGAGSSWAFTCADIIRRPKELNSFWTGCSVYNKETIKLHYSAFGKGIHVLASPHKGPVMLKTFPCPDVIVSAWALFIQCNSKALGLSETENDNQQLPFSGFRKHDKLLGLGQNESLLKHDGCNRGFRFDRNEEGFTDYII